ncbi:MAG: transketolase family protein [Candidatus Dojkabacteria bacterium]|nr:transketolase family protein [Candidatus Dojkabacteria bacterium]MDQ7020828.1 transketolase family protein [Candidatus Dojkabacteria bacterium]
MNKSLNKSIFDKKVELKSTRDGFGEALVEAAKINKEIVALSADLTESVRLNHFKEHFPERFVEVGVAEQNMMGIAAGMAIAGKIPVVGSYAVFNPGRNWDQLRVSVCYSNLNVKVIGGHAGLSVGPDGATHQALEDIAITRVLPNLDVIVPCDYEEARKSTKAMSEIHGPLYLRLGRTSIPVITTEDTNFEIGKAEIFKEGSDVTIVACGIMVYQALVAANQLEKEGIKAEVINNHTIKPLDTDTIIKSAMKTKCIVTAEEHQINAGLGSAIAEAIVKEYPVAIEMVGINNTFGESGDPEELMKKYKITSKDIVSSVKKAIERKTK